MPRLPHGERAFIRAERSEAVPTERQRRASLRRFWKDKSGRRWHPWEITAEEVKKAVADWAWARGMFALHEIGGLVDGRLDAVLLPLSIESPVFKGTQPNCWTRRLGIVGVEIKVSPQDFKKGLETKQFERYCKDLAGLYLAGPKSVIDPKQVPANHGVLFVGKEPDGSCNVICKRHPEWKTEELMDHDKAWRLVWAMAKSMRREIRVVREQYDTDMDKIKSAAGRAIGKAVREIYQ
jgi:hypothetical protein